MTIRRLLATTLLALAMHHACAGDSAFIDKPGLDRTAYTRVMA